MVAVSPLNRLINSFDCDCIRPRHDHEIGIFSCIDCSTYLCHHLPFRNHPFFIHVTTPFGKYLVLDENTRHSCFLILFYGPDDIRHVPVSGIPVCEHRDGDSIDDPGCTTDHLG